MCVCVCVWVCVVSKLEELHGMFRNMTSSMQTLEKTECLVETEFPFYCKWFTYTVPA